MSVTVRQGSSPLVVSFPHVGTDIPDEIAARMSPAALRLDDTDFEQPALYDFTEALGATTLIPRWSRLVIDLNRPPDNAPLYPGQNGTGLIPLETFEGEAIYADDPDEAETQGRLETYWRPYHQALSQALAAAIEHHGHALLWDAHSITGVVPRLFEGRLPDLNMGTADGKACGPAARAAAWAACEASDFTAVLDGRFKGGFITRHYGHPALGVHAIQMELCKHTHLADGPPARIDEARAARLRPVLEAAITGALAAINP
jgi:N-formylglutamate deformylase